MKLSSILCICALAAPPALAATGETDAPAGERCDRLATYPGDFTSPARPVRTEDLDAPRVISACRAALDEPAPALRHLFQLARGLLAAGEARDGVAALTAAARMGHPAALFVLAELHAEGRFVVRDTVLAYALFQDAFRRGHVPGLGGMIALMEDPESGVYDPARAAQARAIGVGGAE